MTPGKFDLVLYRGDSYEWNFALWADANKTDPVDLTDAVVAAEIRDKPGGTSVVTLDCTVTLPNEIAVALTAAMWAGAPTTGAWDLEVSFPTGEVHTVVGGKVTVTADITNSVAR